MATAESPSLTLSFLQHRPETAARVFNDLDVEDVAALLATIPARLAGPIVGFMIPRVAARCMEQLTRERAAAVVRNMTYTDLVSVLRLVSAANLSAILEEMPSKLTRHVQHSLTYPRHTVGAHMDPSVDWLREDDKVSDALKIVRRPESHVISHLFIVETGGRFSGAVRVADLIRSDSTTALSDLTDRTVRPLSNRARLATVISSEDWDEYPVLPVVGRKNNLVGGLSRKELRGDPSSEQRRELTPQHLSILSLLIGAYVMISTALLRMIIAFQPGNMPLETKSDG